MAETASKMIPIGSLAPDFSLPDTVTGKTVSLLDFSKAQGLVVMFICNHCPYVKLINRELVDIAREYSLKGIAAVAISSNDAVNYPDDSPIKMKEHALREKYNFPYLYDESQHVAKAFDAACTPDFFFFDSERKLVYRGRFCEATPGNKVKVTGRDLRQAFDLFLSGAPQNQKQIPSLGCNIKWRKS